jgi:hypothetical protein
MPAALLLLLLLLRLALALLQQLPAKLIAKHLLLLLVRRQATCLQWILQLRRQQKTLKS